MMRYKYIDHPFCQNLRNLMYSANTVQKISSAEIADGVGINYGTLMEYRRGEWLPNIQNLLKLADYFGVSTDYLLGREDYEMEGKK